MANGNATLAALEIEHGRLPRTAEVATGGGGSHRFFRAPRGLRSGVLGPGLDLKAGGGYVVVPPSRHRSGQTYDWKDPLPERVEELPEIPPWLVAGVAEQPSKAERQRASATPTDDRSFPRWLPERVTVGNRHRMLVRVAGWLRGCGYDEDAILAELRTVIAIRVDQPPGDAIGDAWIRRLAHTMGRKPIARFGLRTRYESVAATWKGRAGRTDRHVLFRAVLPIVVRHRKLHGAHQPVPIPSLTVATMADVSDRTAARSLRRLLEKRRVLDYAGRRAHVKDAKRYRLRPPPMPVSPGDEEVRSARARRSETRAASARIPDWDVCREIFLPQGLGPAAEDVFHVLAIDVGQSVARLSRVAGCHLSTGYRVLHRMARHGLVVRGSDGWRRVVVARERLVEITTDLGVLGKIAAGKARRRVQRLIYHSPAGQKRRQRDAAIRRDLQQQLLALAGTRGWPTLGEIAGEAAWRWHVKRTRTRDLWSNLRLLMRQRIPTATTTGRPTKPAKAAGAAVPPHPAAPDPDWSDLDTAEGRNR